MTTTDTKPTPSELDIIQVGPVWQTRSQVRLQAAMAKAQGTIKPVEEDGFDSFKKAKYSTEGALRRSVNEALPPLGLSVSQWFDTGREEVKNQVLNHIDITTRVAHSSGEFTQFTTRIPIESTKGNSFLQDVGRAFTYGARYALGRVIGTYSGDPLSDSTVEQPPEPVRLKRDSAAWRGDTAAVEKHERNEDAATAQRRNEWLNKLVSDHDLSREGLDNFLRAQEWGPKIHRWRENHLRFLAVLIPAMRQAEVDFAEVAIWLGGAAPLGRMNDDNLADVARSIRADGWANSVRQVNRQALGAR